MGYTGWLMPDGKFFPCEHKEHSETIRELLEMPQYRGLMAKNIERGKPYNHTPIASFEGDLTKPVEEFLLKYFVEFNLEQQKCIYTKFMIMYGRNSEICQKLMRTRG